MLKNKSLVVPCVPSRRATAPPYTAAPQLQQQPQAGAASSLPAQPHGQLGALTPQQQAFLAAFSFPTALLQASIMSSATSRVASAEPHQHGASTHPPQHDAAAATSSSSSLPPPAAVERLDHASKVRA